MPKLYLNETCVCNINKMTCSVNTFAVYLISICKKLVTIEDVWDPVEKFAEQKLIIS